MYSSKPILLFKDQGLHSVLQNDNSTNKLITDTVKGQILSSMTYRTPLLDEIADQLCLSKRTLQRKLKNEGQTFRGIIKSVKMLLADQLEVQTNCPTAEIAYNLGYCSSSAYLHARKRWITDN